MKLLVKLEDMDRRNRTQRGYKNCVEQFKREMWVCSREVLGFKGVGSGECLREIIRR